jgi:hypothetical protein
LISSVATDNPAFTVQTNPALPTLAQSIQIDITYDPSAPTSHDAANLIICTTWCPDGPDAGVLVLPLMPP